MLLKKQHCTLSTLYAVLFVYYSLVAIHARCMFLYVKLYVTGPAKIDHVSAINRPFVACLLYRNLYYCNKIFIITTEFNALSFAAYGNGIVHSE